MGTVIKDLVTAGHALSNEMTGAPSALVCELATQLDVQRQIAENSQREFRAADATIHNLELKVAEVISERDAAVSAERIWEKSMMEACGEDGPASVASEIAALRAQRDTALESLRQQLAAVVAESAGLKAGALQEIEVINRGGQAYCVKDGMSVSPIYARGWNDYRAKSLSVETPATDAFLAEVRAQVWIEAKALAKSSVASDSIDHIDFLFDGKVAQLRQGAAL